MCELLIVAHVVVNFRLLLLTTLFLIVVSNISMLGRRVYMLDVDDFLERLVKELLERLVVLQVLRHVRGTSESSSIFKLENSVRALRQRFVSQSRSQSPSL